MRQAWLCVLVVFFGARHLAERFDVASRAFTGRFRPGASVCLRGFGPFLSDVGPLDRSQSRRKASETFQILNESGHPTAGSGAQRWIMVVSRVVVGCDKAHHRW